jgi:hypothetical protein
VTDPKPDDKTLDYDTVVAERKELVKYQQAAYDSYEKTVTALVASTLALSVAFLAFLQASRLPKASLLVEGTALWLYATWGLLVVSLFSLIACFFVNARAFSVEMSILEMAISDAKARTKANPWSAVSYSLYTISAVSFCAGVLALLYFCHANLVNR